MHLDFPAFINSMKRFISRRGIPKLIISDNFSTFKSKELSYRQHGIVHQPILASAPWWGGLGGAAFTKALCDQSNYH